MYKGLQVEVMPFNVEYRDAKYSENALSYFIKNETVEPNNPNYEFVSALYSIYEDITENRKKKNGEEDDENNDAMKEESVDDLKEDEIRRKIKDLDFKLEKANERLKDKLEGLSFLQKAKAKSEDREYSALISLKKEKQYIGALLL